MMPYSSSKLNNSSKTISSCSSSIKSFNSTCPLPSKIQQKAQKGYQLSRDVTSLYELFSTIASTTSATAAMTNNVFCFCCEREIMRKKIYLEPPLEDEDEQEDINKKRKLQDIVPNKLKSAFYYGSSQVRKYMKKVMTRDNWNAILLHGFPCPHQALWNKEQLQEQSQVENNNHYFCTLCDTNQHQSTLRLTLTPATCRAQENEIYGEHYNSQMNKKRTERLMEHCL